MRGVSRAVYLTFFLVLFLQGHNGEERVAGSVSHILHLGRLGCAGDCSDCYGKISLITLDVANLAVLMAQGILPSVTVRSLFVIARRPNAHHRSCW